jgi:hypothetical protein
MVPAEKGTSFRSSSKLPALQVLDDEAKPLYPSARCSKLCVIIGHLRGKLAHQSLQRIDLGRQRGEIEIHAPESNLFGSEHPRRWPS